jgi:hypothetical protein
MAAALNVRPQGQAASTGTGIAMRPSLFTEDDLYLFNEGSHVRLYEKLGCHIGQRENVEGAWFVNQTCVVKLSRMGSAEYRVNLTVTFVLQD